MIYKNFINHCKKLPYLLKLQSISEKHSLQIANKKNVFCVYWSEKRNHSLIFKVLKSVSRFESTNRFIYEHMRIDLWF